MKSVNWVWHWVCHVKWSIAIDMVKTWVLTFPGCGILGFACAKLFLMIL